MNCIKNFLVSPTNRRTPLSTLSWGIFIATSTVMPSLAQQESAIKISGSVIDSESRTPVAYVNVYTKSLSASTVTNDLGKFQISISKKDTLIFSALGFSKYLLSLNQQENLKIYDFVIELNPKTYELAPVKVSAYKDIEQFKQDILDLNIPSHQKGITIEIPKATNGPLPGNSGVGVGVRVSLIYDALSKEGKERRKLEKYHQQEADRKTVQSKYNLEIVKRITNLSDEGALRFMEWCKFEEEFILKATEYDLTVSMLKCLDEFSKNDTLN